MSSRIRNARDYNRSLPAPVRWLHIALAFPAAALGWGRTPECRWALPTVGAAAAIWLLWPLDGPISEWARSIALRGDPRRELEAIQQFGQGTVSVLIGVAIVLAQPARARRLLDWVASAVVVGVAVNLIKPILARPRPNVGDPETLVGPFGKLPIPSGPESYKLVSGWTANYDLGSMPSRHAAFAVVAAVFLAAMYPRLKPLFWLLAAIVCVARVVLGAHWPTDVILGAAIAFVLSDTIVRGYLGVRTLDWLWVRLVDRQARPALPALLAAERGRMA